MQEKIFHMSATTPTVATRPVDLYEGFTNRISGESFRCLSNKEQAIAFEWTVQPNGYVPFEHTHLNQDEMFRVLRGELKVVIEGREVVGGPGDIITVRKGQRHIAFNNKPELLNCLVTFEPALDTYQFFQCFGGLTRDHDLDRKGGVNVPKMLYFTRRMNAKCLARPSSVPPFLFKIAIRFFYFVGTILGWEKDFLRYTHDTSAQGSPAI